MAKRTTNRDYRRCTRCDEILPLEMFPFRRKDKDQRHADCSPCRRVEHFERRYGVTMAQWDTLLNGQDNRCAICGTDDWGPRGPQLDHNHDSGKARGLLCSHCNLGLGHLGDDQGRVRNALAYLNSPPAERFI